MTIAADISLVIFSHHVHEGNSQEIRYILSSLNFQTAKVLINGYDLKQIYEERLNCSLPIQGLSLILIFFSYCCYYGYIRYIFIVTAEEIPKTLVYFIFV